ncbi:unnamed protein product [Adineta ricciae]|uniref:AAA+ ATPase domain-containing protein n=1 Tax=Adineta ricciae TaxID=249248 RepID=A0A814V718_ADIRI|nr:unnamed protein product [Adineta ricciae]CAF1181486.1 unnamed protein product [Adineta ricciae]
MASALPKVSVYEYFKSGLSVSDGKVIAFRDCYAEITSIDQFDGHVVNETALDNTSERLGIQVGSDVDRDILHTCIRQDDLEQVLDSLSIILQSQPQASPSDASGTQTTSATVPQQSQDEETPTELTEVECITIVKNRTNEVDTFIETFLLQVAGGVSSTTSRSTTNNLPFSNYNNKFILDPNSTFALFIREQVSSRGIIRQRQSARLRLVEPVSITDEFSSWSYDHLRDLFHIELRSHSERTFPSCWVLNKGVRIHCQFVVDGAQQNSESEISSIVDCPRTGSLEQFVHDVCDKEDNGQANAWLKALREEDILTFAHLSNLKQTEWDNIRKLSMNARRILKTAVDRERESATDNRRRLFEESSPNQELPSTTDKSKRGSRSELLASLHLIKLFIYHTLRFERVFSNHSSLPKIEADCIDASFDEMREEGYADDGLFSPMGEFFLPLTITEEELRMSRSHGGNQAKEAKIKELDNKIRGLEEQWLDAKKNVLDFNERINDLNRTMEALRVSYTEERSQIDTNSTSRVRARKLHDVDQQWRYDQNNIEKQINEHRQKMNKWINAMTTHEKQVDDLKTEKRNVEAELKKPQLPVDKGLVKPARGFIMYGPPGTGKSEIMSKLCVKLGICMVGPPLAAGELNRPLVGESERVIIALASRCNRVPYAMCCLSIDEIDSLAPKRDEDSSEGKVDKISVLLSLIDGIKDVPNMMIFCATNRLHMMDEAFLRRMSGKFFVGRPSSKARMAILNQIPEWALEPNLTDCLVIATTNFSGAACKAFTRAVTVRCMAAQRTRPNFHVDHREALIIADRTAQQYQIFLGSETLPRLLLRNLINKSEIRVNSLSRYVYTGRIIVDLSGGSARVEIVEQSQHIGITEHKLYASETTTQSLLERLTIYGKDRNVQLLQLIDLNLLASQGAYDEKKVFETLKERYDECVAYTRSMIIYDLDALVGVNKSESDSSMGRSMSSSVVNQSIYTYVRARFREAVVEQSQGDNSGQQQTVEKWAVAVIREPFLLRQFSSDVQFARTRFEEREAEMERRKAEDLLKCVKCKDHYIENENKMGNCVHHDGFVYDVSVPDLTMYTPSQVTYELNKLEYGMVTNPDRREEYERQKNKFKWICCDATVTATTGAGGCKKGKHSCGINDESGDEQRQDLSYLDEARINRWEKECQRNREYNDKWLRLLESRG